MTLTTPDRSTHSSTSSISYPSLTIRRAARAMRCTPFTLHLFLAMREKSVELKAIANQPGVRQRYTRHLVSELVAESHLLWLIQVGLLRREVDGQGLTDSFRLTPLGHLLTEQYQQQGKALPEATLSDRLYNALSRWVRLPSWVQV
jgi:hypothetical protein